MNDSPLHNAAWGGNLNRVKELLNSGAKNNINARNRSGTTPLIAAINRRRLAVVKELLNRGANVNLRNNNNHAMTPLMHAMSIMNAVSRTGESTWRRGSLPIVKELLKRGATTRGALNVKLYTFPKIGINANIRKAIMKHNAGLTIAKYHRASTIRRKAASIAAMRRQFPNNVVRRITSIRQ